MDFLLAHINCSISMIYSSIAIILATALYYLYKNRNVPPGPIGIPILGYWPFLNTETCHLQMQKLGEKYGNVFSFMSTGRLFVNLGSIKVIKEAQLAKHEYFVNRLADNNILYYYFDGGIMFTNGEHWKILRKFFQQEFKERGMTVIKDIFSGPIYDTVQQTVTDLKETKGKPVDIYDILLTKCSRIIIKTLFGDDGVTEEEMKEFNEGYHSILMTMTSTNLMTCGFISKYFVIPFAKGISKGRKGHKIMQNIMHKAIERRKSTYDENHIRDVIDAYYRERNDRKARNDPTAKYFTDKCLVVSLIQVIGDGVIFLALFLAAYMRALLDHPEEQEKLYQELIEVVGVDRYPTIEDKSKLSYMNAFVAEVMRSTDLITVFPSFECDKETTLAGYRIPKGAVLINNFWMAHMNPEDYDHPEIFNPSRFLVTDKKKRPEFPVSFGLGKRACLGEGFTMIQIFLYLTTIIKNFHFTRPENEAQKTSLYHVDNKIYVCAKPR